MKLEPKFPGFADKIKESFSKQAVMALIGGELAKVEAGAVDIKLPYRSDLTQQDGFIHAGITTMIADSACGYSALSLMAETEDVLSVEFKVNLLSPAIGEYLLAEGRVLRAGRNLTIVRGDVFAIRENGRKIVAAMLGTMSIRRDGNQ